MTINNYIEKYEERIRQINILRLKDLRELKQIDCFNEAYTTDPRPAKHIDIKIKELESKLENKLDT